MLGLERKKVRLSEYDPEWVSCYKSQSTAIRSALTDQVVDIQHVGSTSVPGLKAKPIVDIMVGLKSFEQIESVIHKMEGLGFTYAHWAGIPGDYTFRIGELTTYLIHVVEYDSSNWNHKIKFRDALRNSTDLAHEYSALKERLAKQYPDSREDYTEGKTDFIMDVIK